MVRAGKLAVRPALPPHQDPLAFVKPPSDTAILSTLTSGWADVVFTYDVEKDERLAQELADKGLTYTALGDERLSITMSRENPLARAHALSQNDLRDVTIMGGLRESFRAHLRFTHRADESNRQVRAFLDEALALAPADTSRKGD